MEPGKRAWSRETVGRAVALLIGATGVLWALPAGIDHIKRETLWRAVQTWAQSSDVATRTQMEHRVAALGTWGVQRLAASVATWDARFQDPSFRVACLQLFQRCGVPDPQSAAALQQAFQGLPLTEATRDRYALTTLMFTQMAPSDRPTLETLTQEVERAAASEAAPYYLNVTALRLNDWAERADRKLIDSLNEALDNAGQPASGFLALTLLENGAEGPIPTQAWVDLIALEPEAIAAQAVHTLYMLQARSVDDVTRIESRMPPDSAVASVHAILNRFSETDDPIARGLAAKTMGYLGAEALPALMNACQAPQSPRRELGAKGLYTYVYRRTHDSGTQAPWSPIEKGQFFQQARPILETLLQDADAPRTQRHALALIEALDTAARPIARHVLALVDHSDPELARRARAVYNTLL